MGITSIIYEQIHNKDHITERYKLENIYRKQ